MIWKKILLLVANYKTTGYDFYDSAFPPLAFEYIAANVEDLVEVRIIDSKAAKLNLSQVKKEIKNYQPDLVGLTVPVTSAIDTVLQHAKIAKLYGSTTVIGGWHPTLATEQTLSSPWIDILVRGEGEFTFRELIEKGSPVNIRGLSYKMNGKLIHNPDRPFLKNLDELRPPSRHLVKNYKYKIFNMNCDTIETSRGCPQACKFCSTNVVYNQTWRSRSVENIMEELEIISKNKKISDVFFVDDNFLVNMKRIGRLSFEIIKGKRMGRIRKKLFFFFQGRLDSMARHPKVVKLMAEAGFWLVLVGVEATDDKGLKAVAKGCNINQIKKGIKVLHENEITVMGNVIIGANLNASVDDVFTTIKKTRELSLDLPSFTLLTPFPATKFYNEIKEKDLLLTEEYNKFNWLNPVIKTQYLSPEILKKLLFLGFYSIGYYGGNLRNKFYLYRRTVRSRGIFYVINPLRFYRGLSSYFKWKKIVLDNLRDIKKKKIRQIRGGNRNKIADLKRTINDMAI
ncbi:MAG: radical SAM protein [Candidatus Lokiarchaeota archaeon]|nr:radical SAM protein [Candidatus Lokiarchaeota archaeon]